MAAKGDLLRLRAELDADMELLESHANQNARAMQRIENGADDELDYAALGYTVHNLYSIIENYALRIAKTFENSLGDSSWHRELIYRMTLEIPQTRPRVWSRELSRDIDELRRFRHAFRHIYDSKVEPDKLMVAQSRVPRVLSGICDAHAEFQAKLSALIEELDEG